MKVTIQKTTRHTEDEVIDVEFPVYIRDGEVGEYTHEDTVSRIEASGRFVSITEHTEICPAAKTWSLHVSHIDLKTDLAGYLENSGASARVKQENFEASMARFIHEMEAALAT
jgi:hypothetical protein